MMKTKDGACLAIVLAAAMVALSLGTATLPVTSDSVRESTEPRNRANALEYSWTDAQPLLTPRAYSATVMLEDGRILVIGGITANGPTASTEVFDYDIGAWVPGPTMTTKRVGHTATLLPDGSVLVVGGDTEVGATASAEIISSNVSTSLAIPGMTFARSGHAAILLRDGRVLVTGGTDWKTGVWNQAEEFDLAQKKWLPAGTMAAKRMLFSFQDLPDGSVIAAGGDDSGTSERFTPANGTWWGLSTMNSKRVRACSSALQDGRVLVAGGIVDNSAIRTAELFDPVSNTWTATGQMAQARTSFTLDRLPSGSLLAAGSFALAGSSASCELFHPENGTWTVTKAMNISRGAHGSAPIPDGGVLVFGGWSGAALTSRSEVYSPVPFEGPRYCEPIDLVPLVLEATELPGGSQNGLIAKLLAAQSSFENRSIETCLNIMHAFINQEIAFARNGHMSQEHASSIYAGYASVVACLGGVPEARS